MFPSTSNLSIATVPVPEGLITRSSLERVVVMLLPTKDIESLKDRHQFVNPEEMIEELEKICSDSKDKFFLTRIETLTVSGVPDVFGIYNNISFWLELKSNQVNYPTLNKFQISWINRAVKHGGKIFILHEAQKERLLKIYKINSFFTDPRSISPVFICKKPVTWSLFVDRLKSLLLT